MWKFILLQLFALHLCKATVNPGDGVQFPAPLIEIEGEPLGHLKPYGMQSAPEGPVKEYDQPLPAQEFWDKHVKDHIPLVYRQAIKKSPAIKKWTDEYLAEKYGDLDVLVELKKENRTSSSGRMRLRDFLKLYEKEQLYVVSMLPSEMMVDIQAVPSVLCGTFKNYTHESNLWISNGGTRSVIHYDADHNLHCMIAGRKDFMMIQNKYSEDLYFGKKPRGVGSGFSKLDPDVIDMNLYPNHGKVPWTWATLYAGDCIFIPSVYIHQVRAYGRSIAATTLFTADVHDNFTGADCTQDIMKGYHSMSEIDFRWTYKKGDETIDMGFMNDELTRQRLRECLLDDDKFRQRNGRMYWKHFIRFGFSFPHVKMIRNYTKAKDVFDELAGDKGYLDMDTLNNCTREQMKLVVRLTENPHGIVTNGKEEILARPGEKHKYDEGPFDAAETQKFMDAALITERQKQLYYRLIMLEMGEDDDEKEEEGNRDEEDDEKEKEGDRDEEEDDEPTAEAERDEEDEPSDEGEAKDGQEDKQTEDDDDLKDSKQARDEL